jgi:hypothetical protein
MFIASDMFVHQPLLNFINANLNLSTCVERHCQSKLFYSDHMHSAVDLCTFCDVMCHWCVAGVIHVYVPHDMNLPLKSCDMMIPL